LSFTDLFSFFQVGLVEKYRGTLVRVGSQTHFASIHLIHCLDLVRHYCYQIDCFKNLHVDWVNCRKADCIGRRNRLVAEGSMDLLATMSRMDQQVNLAAKESISHKYLLAHARYRYLGGLACQSCFVNTYHHQHSDLNEPILVVAIHHSNCFRNIIHLPYFPPLLRNCTIRFHNPPILLKHVNPLAYQMDLTITSSFQ